MRLEERKEYKFAIEKRPTRLLRLNLGTRMENKGEVVPKARIVKNHIANLSQKSGFVLHIDAKSMACFAQKRKGVSVCR